MARISIKKLPYLSSEIKVWTVRCEKHLGSFYAQDWDEALRYAYGHAKWHRFANQG